MIFRRRGIERLKRGGGGGCEKFEVMKKEVKAYKFDEYWECPTCY